MVNKQTINFNCGQLKQLIVKTINFLEALVVGYLISYVDYFSCLYIIIRNISLFFTQMQ